MAKKKKKAAPKKKRTASTRSKPISLQAAINKSGFDWKASAGDPFYGVTPGTGLIVNEVELREIRTQIKSANSLESTARAFAAPASVDWRNNGGNWVTSVKNQGGCGSCVSFATCATIEARVNIVCKNTNVDLDLSEAHMFFCGCGNCCDNGWQFTPALNFAKNTGVGQESDFPYTPNNQDCKQITPKLKIDSWRRLSSISERKDSLSSHGPVVGGMRVFSDFYNYSSGVYRKTADAEFKGNHAICFVGYNDADKCWIAKNSWGSNWGESGFFRIGYGECDVDSSFFFYQVDLKCPEEITPENCSQYVPFLRRVLEVARYDWRLRNCLRYYICNRGQRPRCSSRELRIVRYVAIILRRCPQYRNPFCRIIG